MRGRGRTMIGVEVDGRWVHAAQLVRAGAGWRVGASAEYRRAPGASLGAEAERLAGVLDRRGFHGGQVVLAAPQERVLTGVLELPPRSSRAPVEQLASAEIGRLHRVDAAAMEVALWEVPAARRTGAGCDYMVAGCPHAVAEEWMDAFEGAGLRVRAIDLAQLAMVRAWSGEVRGGSTMDALLHLGWDRCVLIVLVDGVVAYERRLEGAEGRVLVESVGTRTGMEPEAAEDMLTGAMGAESARALGVELRGAATAHVAALAEQVHTSFSYISRRYPDRDVGSVLMSGRFAELEGLGPRLAQLGVRVEAGGEGCAAPRASLVVAAGLALHGEGASS